MAKSEEEIKDMFHFDFWLDPHDVELLFHAIRGQISEAHMELLKLHSGRKPNLYPGATEKSIEAYIAWYKGHIEYLEALIVTMDPVINPNKPKPPTREQKIGMMADAYRASGHSSADSFELSKLMGDVLTALENKEI